MITSKTNARHQEALDVSFRMIFATALFLAAIVASAPSYSQKTSSGAAISIQLKNNTERERQTKVQLERLLATYDLLDLSARVYLL